MSITTTTTNNSSANSIKNSNIIVPKSEKDFTDLAYWRRFFKHNTSFEWYGDYTKLGAVFEKYIKSNDAILQIGCGNSSLADDLCDNGFRNILSIDTDANVIEKQQKRNCLKRPTLKFETCSASKIQFLPDSSINVAVDKGTLDALLTKEQTEADVEIVEAMFGEVVRCLAPFGRYIVVTLAQQHIVTKLLNFFGKPHFMLRFQNCPQTNNGEAEEEFVLPVFVVVVTKLKMPLAQSRKIEYLRSIDAQPENVESVEQLFEKIEAAQQINWFKHHLARGPIDEASVAICSTDGRERYQLTVVDDPSQKTLIKYGIFIVPLGRENDWLFSTSKGRNILRSNCNLHRLLVVRLSRGQHYESLEAIQSELNSIVIDFMPNTCNIQMTKYLSLGSTDVSETIESGTSKISGHWTVEHVSINEAMFRRLVFLDSCNLVQTEVEVKKRERRERIGQKLVVAAAVNNNGKNNNNNNNEKRQNGVGAKNNEDKNGANNNEEDCGCWQIDWSEPFESCEHLKQMMLAFLFLSGADGKRSSSSFTIDSMEEEVLLNATLRMAVLGVGGGILVKGLHDAFKKSTIVGVELDPEVIEIAERHFEFPKSSERIQVEICDALNFLQEEAATAKSVNERFDVIFVDLAGNANKEGLYCPPPQFVTRQMLECMKQCLRDGGVLALNLVTRDEQTAIVVKNALASVFASVHFVKGEEDINEVVLCSTVEQQQQKPQQHSSAPIAAKNKNYSKSGKQRKGVRQQKQQQQIQSESAGKFLKDCLVRKEKLCHFSKIEWKEV